MFKRSIILSAMVASLAWSVVVKARPIVIPEGTRVRIRLEERISSATVEEGQAIRLGVADDIKINQTTVIKLNSVVNGTVTESVAKRRLGRTGKLDFSVDTINASDGGKIPVRYTIMKKEGGSHVVRTGVVAALVAMTYPPAAPLVLLATGKDVTLYRGFIFQVFTDTDYEMNLDTEESLDKVFVFFDSKPTHAEIWLDGKFHGHTRDSFNVSVGTHLVLIKTENGEACWERSVEFDALTKSRTLSGTLTANGCH